MLQCQKSLVFRLPKKKKNSTKKIALCLLNYSPLPAHGLARLGQLRFTRPDFMTMDMSATIGGVRSEPLGQVAPWGAVSPCAQRPASVRNTATEAITRSHLALSSPDESSLLFLCKTGFFFLLTKKRNIQAFHK